MNNSQPQHTTFPRPMGSYSDMFREYAHSTTVNRIEGIVPKTLMILIGDSNDRIPLKEWMLTNTSTGEVLSNCTKWHAHGYCCDAEDAAHAINVTFCNVFIFGVKMDCGECGYGIRNGLQGGWYREGVSANESKRIGALSEAALLKEASYETLLDNHLLKWSEIYGVNVSEECQSGRWKCHAMFQSMQWDVVCRESDLKKVHEYKQGLWDLFQYIKNDAFPFVGDDLIWRTAPIASDWAPTQHQGSDTKITTVNAMNRMGLNLFESERQQERMRVFHWANFMPVAAKSGPDTHHWNEKYNHLYLGLLYRYTTLPPRSGNKPNSMSKYSE